MDDKEDTSPFTKRIGTSNLAGSKPSQTFRGLAGLPPDVSPFTQISNTAAVQNVNPFAVASQASGAKQQNLFGFQSNTDKPTTNFFNSPVKPLFSAFTSPPISSSTGFLPSQETSERLTLFGGSTAGNQTSRESSPFSGVSSSKNIFKRSVIGEDSAGVNVTSGTQAQQDTDIAAVDPETGGPLGSASGSDPKGLFIGRKIDFKRKPTSSQTRSGKNEASVRPRARQDPPSSKRDRRGDSDIYAQATVGSRKIAKSDNTFGDPASVDISELEKFGGGRKPKSRDSSPCKESKSAESSPRKRSEVRRGGIFGAALKATGIETGKKKKVPTATLR